LKPLLEKHEVGLRRPNAEFAKADFVPLQPRIHSPMKK